MNENYENNPQVNTADIDKQEYDIEKSAESNELQVSGLICGILSILSFWCCGFFGTIFGIVGLICCIKGNKKSKHRVGSVGLVCSIIGLILGLGMFFYSISFCIKALKSLRFLNG